ncbi:Type 1 glutamine amidotransferase-like domain-containing protein [Mediterraneibacter glycyrrhizinilyticus]|nr:Type 1 glutamine amidotransferase-like domain-containing protein [Mediterraneibacter glycyrrhizinilyticus]MBM6803662.1 Type 1 glutamine amidotransferase-like domain-containing protein [Mediterraneibacter glycyrrhizinilyticus]
MKKLILVSMLYKVTDLVRTITPELEGKTVTYIPTAGIAEDVEGMVEEETSTLESLGMTVDVLEVSSASYDSIVNSLTKNDIIFVGGGNTFFLLQELRRSGADQILIREVEKGKLYIGESAGSIITCPDIGYCAEMDSPEKAPDLIDYAGLNLVDFYIVPHIGNAEMGEAAEKAVEKYSSELELKAITDEQVILVEEGRVEILE